MATYTNNVRTADLKAGDRLAERPLWGEITAVTPYRPGPGADRAALGDTATWRVARFESGVEVTLSGGTWFPG